MAVVSGHERVLVLVKALPHPSEKHGETVCCAGVTPDREWRRQFPVPFRYLEEQQFARWQWVEYDWRAPRDDNRPESRRVQEGSIRAHSVLPAKERANFLQPIIAESTTDAFEIGHTLTLIRPRHTRFYFKKKTVDQISVERDDYVRAQSQFSFLTKQKHALEPCPYDFRYKYETADGKHDHSCGDWETSATFFNHRSRYGEDEALKYMKDTFGKEYPQKGMVFAMGTHSVRKRQWLLVGVLRLDELQQMELI